MKTKQDILARAKINREEVTQYFNDISHWNNTRGKTEGVIDPDPTGEMHRYAESLDAMLAREL